MKYIDVNKLKEKIYAEDTVSLAHGSSPEFDQGCHYAFLTVLSLIDSLQQEQPEMDLEKEIEVCWETYLKDAFGMPIEGRITKYEVEEIARHFYALGINA